jgi:hypothetical protein
MGGRTENVRKSFEPRTRNISFSVWYEIYVQYAALKDRWLGRNLWALYHALGHGGSAVGFWYLICPNPKCKERRWDNRLAMWPWEDNTWCSKRLTSDQVRVNPALLWHTEDSGRKQRKENAELVGPWIIVLIKFRVSEHWSAVALVLYSTMAKQESRHPQ